MQAVRQRLDRCPCWRRSRTQPCRSVEDPRLALSLENLHAQRRAVESIAWDHHIERAVGEADENIHLGAQLDVIARLVHWLLDPPASGGTIVDEVHVEVKGIGQVLRGNAVRSDSPGDVLLAAVPRAVSVRLI